LMRLAFTMAHGIPPTSRRLSGVGWPWKRFAPRLASFVAAGRLLDEAATFRAVPAACGARILKERFGATRPESMRLRSTARPRRPPSRARSR